MGKIDLLLDEENELTFQLNIEGNSPGTAKCRLKLDNNDLGLIFEARAVEKGEVSVFLPPLAHILKEGDYNMTLEVVVDDKFCEPLSLVGSFEKNIKVTAEAVVRRPPRKQTSVTASTITEDSVPIVTVRNSKSSKEKKPIVLENETQKKTKRRRIVSDKEILNLIEALKNK